MPGYSRQLVVVILVLSSRFRFEKKFKKRLKLLLIRILAYIFNLKLFPKKENVRIMSQQQHQRAQQQLYNNPLTSRCTNGGKNEVTLGAVCVRRISLVLCMILSLQMAARWCIGRVIFRCLGRSILIYFKCCISDIITVLVFLVLSALVFLDRRRIRWQRADPREERAPPPCWSSSSTRPR